MFVSSGYAGSKLSGEHHGTYIKTRSAGCYRRALLALTPSPDTGTKKGGIKLPLAPVDKFYLGSVLALHCTSCNNIFHLINRTGLKGCGPQLSRLSVCPEWRPEGVIRLVAAELPKDGLFLTSFKAS